MPRGHGKGPISFDVVAQDLTRAVADLKSVGERQLVNELRRGVRKAGQPLVRKVAHNAASFSRRIPIATRIRSSYPRRGAQVKVEVDPKRAPHAAPINNKGRPGFFRHPLWGRDEWVQQRAIPFFDKATADERQRIIAELDRVAANIQKRAGF